MQHNLIDKRIAKAKPPINTDEKKSECGSELLAKAINPFNPKTEISEEIMQFNEFNFNQEKRLI